MNPRALLPIWRHLRNACLFCDLLIGKKKKAFESCGHIIHKSLGCSKRIMTCVFQMPSTRSQGHAQPTLAFPRRKSCRVSSRSKTPHVEQPLVCSPTKPEPRIRPLSPRHSAHRPTPLSPRRPAAPPPSPSLQPRLPLSPRKRTGEHFLEVIVLYFHT